MLFSPQVLSDSSRPHGIRQITGNNSPMALVVKNPAAMQETQEMWFQSLGQEDPVEEEMTTHSSILAWKIPQTEEPGRLQSVGSQRVRHDSTQAWTHGLREYWTDFALHMLWKWKPLNSNSLIFYDFIFRKTNYENYCLKTNESKALLESSVNATQVAFICAVLWHKIAFHFSHQNIG